MRRRVGTCFRERKGDLPGPIRVQAEGMPRPCRRQSGKTHTPQREMRLAQSRCPVVTAGHLRNTLIQPSPRSPPSREEVPGWREGSITSQRRMTPSRRETVPSRTTAIIARPRTSQARRAALREPPSGTVDAIVPGTGIESLHRRGWPESIDTPPEIRGFPGTSRSPSASTERAGKWRPSPRPVSGWSPSWWALLAPAGSSAWPSGGYNTGFFGGTLSAKWTPWVGFRGPRPLPL